MGESLGIMRSSCGLKLVIPVLIYAFYLSVFVFHLVTKYLETASQTIKPCSKIHAISFRSQDLVVLSLSCVEAQQRPGESLCSLEENETPKVPSLNYNKDVASWQNCTTQFRP